MIHSPHCEVVVESIGGKAYKIGGKHICQVIFIEQ